MLRRNVGIGYGALTGTVLRRPLIRTSGALGQLPLVAEEALEEVVAPLRRRRAPRHFETAGDGVVCHAGPVTVLPTEALRFERCGLRFGAKVGSGGRAMCLPE